MFKIKPWKELTIRDNFMFQKVLRNKRLCKRFIEKTLRIKIKRIIYLETEKTIDEKYGSKSVRIDVFVETDSGEIIDIEMQAADMLEGELPLRTRYYQALIDMAALAKGHTYMELKRSYIILNYSCL